MTFCCFQTIFPIWEQRKSQRKRWFSPMDFKNGDFCFAAVQKLIYFFFIYPWHLKVFNRKDLQEIKEEISSFSVWCGLCFFCFLAVFWALLKNLAPQSIIMHIREIRSAWAGATDSREEYSPLSPWWSSAGRTGCSGTDGRDGNKWVSAVCTPISDKITSVLNYIQ